MSVDRRRANANWTVADHSGDIHIELREGVTLAVLMDIRDELRKLNAVFHCGNFLSLPLKVERIARNTSKPRKRATKGAR